MLELKKWIDANELMKRWDINRYDLADLVIQGDLTAYDPSDNTALNIDIEKEDPLDFIIKWKMLPPEREPLFERIDGFIFKVDQIVEVENKSKINQQGSHKETKLRPNQEHKKKVKEIARSIWEKDPTTTIEAMSKMKEIVEIGINYKGKPYTAKTIRSWTKEDCPNRSSGRRPKLQ